MTQRAGNGRGNGGRNGSGRKANGRETTDPLTRLRDLSQQALEDCDRAYLERFELQQRCLKEIEKEIQAALRMEDMLGAPWRHGQDSIQYEFMRIALNKAITARKKERRDRLLQAWRDLAELRERRVALEREHAAVAAQ